MVDKKSLSERDICSKYITPAVTAAGWDLHAQIRKEVNFITPPGWWHSHHNDSDQDAIVLPIQDAGLVMNMQALDFKLEKIA